MTPRDPFPEMAQPDPDTDTPLPESRSGFACVWGLVTGIVVLALVSGLVWAGVWR